MHEVDIYLKIENLIAEVKKNRFGSIGIRYDLIHEKELRGEKDESFDERKN